VIKIAGERQYTVQEPIAVKKPAAPPRNKNLSGAPMRALRRSDAWSPNQNQPHPVVIMDPQAARVLT